VGVGKLLAAAFHGHCDCGRESRQTQHLRKSDRGRPRGARDSVGGARETGAPPLRAAGAAARGPGLGGGWAAELANKKNKEVSN
jgi:hypothetical protein